jgi:hypothetical protein
MRVALRAGRRQRERVPGTVVPDRRAGRNRLPRHPGPRGPGREIVAENLDDYEEIGARLAQDLPHLADLRSGPRERMAGSPLCDGKRFSADLMSVVRRVWKE